MPVIWLSEYMGKIGRDGQPVDNARDQQHALVQVHRQWTGMRWGYIGNTCTLMAFLVHCGTYDYVGAPYLV